MSRPGNFEDCGMEKHGKYPAEMKERAIRPVFETQGEYSSQTAAIKSIAQDVWLCV